jgi:hypothetical protein
VESGLDGAGVFVPEASILALKMMDEEESGLQIDSRSTGAIEKMMHEGRTRNDSSIDSINAVVVSDPSDPRRFYKFGNCSNYAKIMHFPGVYGTENELRVAALIYDVAIVVRIGTGVEEKFHYFFPKQFKSPRRIIYMFKAQKQGHYDSMVGTGMMDGFDIYGLPVNSYIAECIASPQVLASSEALSMPPILQSSVQRRAAMPSLSRSLLNTDDLNYVESERPILHSHSPLQTSSNVVDVRRPQLPVVAASAVKLNSNTKRANVLARLLSEETETGGKSKRKYNIMKKKKHTTRRKRSVKGGKSRRCRKPCNKNLSRKF